MMWYSTVVNSNITTLVFVLFFLHIFHVPSISSSFYCYFSFFLILLAHYFFPLLSGSKFILLFSWWFLCSLTFSLLYLHSWYCCFFLPFCFFSFLMPPQCGFPLKYSCTTKTWGHCEGWQVRTYFCRQPDYNQISAAGETKMQCNLSHYEARIHRMVCCVPLTVHDFPALQRPLISNYK